MRPIIAWCLGNRTVVLLFTGILLVAGAFSAFRINQELVPDISFPTVYVVVPDPGASPETVDREISLPLTEALNGTPKLTKITTTARQSAAVAILQFSIDQNTREAVTEVTQRLNQVVLPQSAGRPVVETFSFAALATMTYTLSAVDGDLLRATREAREVIAPALRNADGVATVRVIGGEQDRVRVTLDPARLAARGISQIEVQQALAGASVLVPAGLVDQNGRAVPVEVAGDVGGLGRLEALVVGGSPAAGRPAGAAGSSPVRLGEVATIEPVRVPISGISRSNGVPALSIEVVKAAGANSVTVSDSVKRILAGLKLNPSDRLYLAADQAVDVRQSVNGLLLEGLVGALLAVIVIFLFLRSLRATLVSAVSLPTSILVALWGTNAFGFSLNVLTLAGLTIAVGRVVDDAIVVLENSYRHLQMGESPVEAAENGAAEVATAVLSSTFTTVAVYLPIGIAGGFISKFFFGFSITVAIALLASLVVALTVVPVLVSYFLKARPGGGAAEGSGLMVRLYRPVVELALSGWPGKTLTVLLSVALLAGSLAAVVVTKVPVTFFSGGEGTAITGTISLPPGTSLEESSRQLRAFEQFTGQNPEIVNTTVTIGSSSDAGLFVPAATDQAVVTVRVRSKSRAPAVRDQLKARADALYGPGSAFFAVVTNGPPTGNYEVTIKGADDGKLKAASDLVVARLQEEPDLLNVRSEIGAAKPELRVEVDPNRAAAAGLTPKAVGQVLQLVLNEVPVGSLSPVGPPVSLRLDPSAVTAQRLPDLPLGPGLKLKDIAAITSGQAAPTISRTNGVRTVTVSADIRGEDTQGISTRATADVKKLTLPEGVTFDTGGTSADIATSFASLGQVMLIAVGLIFVLLVAFFRSVVTPFVILVSLPLALIGAALALVFSREPLGLPAALGVLVVFGIVVSNAILLIDFTQRLAQEMPVPEALVRAGSVRLRPILMTAVATIVALAPVAIGISGEGGLVGRSLALVVEGGLISSTFLTLVAVPVIYSLVVRRPPRLPGSQPGAEAARTGAARLGPGMIEPGPGGS